ncbi:MAG: cyclic nucleotide-binding domain-containing protein [Elainella sp. C42_A2020_010]|nr:cyclic nucleotide-binding domain-containing protein [Elainella sp. C42_A2020_010]
MNSTTQESELFPKLSDEELDRLKAHGQELQLNPGQIIFQEGDPSYQFYVVLEGQVQITRRIGMEEQILALHDPGEFTGEISMIVGKPATATARAIGPTRVLEYGADTLFGELPVLTGETHFWAAGRAISYCHIFELGVTAFWELLASCPCVTTTILSTMAKRMQAVQSLSQHRQKMVALGTLAAGLAHELNNPASAAQRSTQQLRETSQTLKAATLELHHHLSCAQQAWLAELHQTLMQQAIHAVVLDPLTQSDREDEMMDWLHAQGVSDCWRLAPTLVSAGLDVESLTQIASQLPASALQAVLIWLEASLTELRLFDELDHATERIGQMVKAVKDYSYMDQAPLQDIDIHEGLESTLIMLRHKLKQGIEVTRQYDRQLPRITAYGSELNQVWTNLIDNAIDALADFNKQATPTIQIHTRRENETILVEIIDNGPGIPAEIRSQIFAPFFTTKGVGRGTGLGLHIAYRVIVEQHQGDLRVSSEPGNTRFQIRLPIRL